MGTNVSSNKRKPPDSSQDPQADPATSRPQSNTNAPTDQAQADTVNGPLPTDQYNPYPAPTDPYRPNPRPGRLSQKAHPAAYRDPVADDFQPTEDANGQAVNPWLDTSPVPPHSLSPQPHRAAPAQRPAVPAYDSPEPAGAPPLRQDPAPPPARRQPAPPPYRQEVGPEHYQPEFAPAPIYQPVRQRPFRGHGEGLPPYQPPAYSHRIPPRLPPPPNRYPHAGRLQPYQPHVRPRLVPKPYAVEPLQYRQVAAIPDQQPAVRGEPIHGHNQQIPGPTHNQDHEVESLLSQDLRPKDDIPDEAQVKKEKDDDDYIGANLRFYRNEIKFRPNGEYIDNVHKYWQGDYKKLEDTHTFIQWLFPISERSRVNPEAVPLRTHEAKHIGEDKETHARVLQSYRFMLDFYGFQLTDETTGKIARASNWKDRFYVLKRSYHNHFRITRIIRSLGELGLVSYQAPLVMGLLHEIFETGELYGISPVAIHHWLRTISETFDRDYVYNLFKTKLSKLEKDYQAARQHESNRDYYETFPKRRKYGSFRKPYY